MPRYSVWWTETAWYHVNLDAKNEKEAKRKALKMDRNEAFEGGPEDLDMEITQIAK